MSKVSSQNSYRRASSGLFGGWLVIYLAVPFVGLAVYVFVHGVGSAPTLLSAVYISTATATITTVILIIFGIPLASFLAHSNSVPATVAKTLVRLPLGIPPLVSGVMLLIAFGPYSIIGRLFGGRLTDSMAAIVLAQLFVEMPFVIEGTRAAFSALSEEVFEVSSLLGIPNWRRILGIELPLGIRNVRAAVMMGWLRAFGEFGATVLVAYHPTSLPVLIFTQFSGVGLNSAILPVAAVLVVSLVAAVLISRIRTPVVLFLGVERPVSSTFKLPGSLGRKRAIDGNASISFAVSGKAGNFHMDLALEVPGSSLALTGPSGAGKSMTLRALTGLSPTLLKKLVLTGAENPKIAFVPQGQGLFDHLDVYSQIAAAARWSGGLRAKAEINTRVIEAANQVGVVELLDRKVPTLSGGQRQRVALARAVAILPDLLILDEPFSALDRFERDRQIRFVRRLVQELNIYLIVVTHDIEEAAFLSSQLAIINRGHLLTLGSVANLIGQPGTAEVAQIIGYENILDLLSSDSGKLKVQANHKDLNGDTGSIAFRSSGFRSLSVNRSPLSVNLGFEIVVTKDRLILQGAGLVDDFVDLGSSKIVIFTDGGDVKIEFQSPDIFESLVPGDSVDLLVELDPARVPFLGSLADLSSRLETAKRK